MDQPPIEILRLPFRTTDREMLVEQRTQVLHESAAAADDHLEQQRLALLQGHTAIATDGLIAPGLRQTEVIHRVTGLVHRAEQAGEGIGAVEARRDADVAGNAFSEGMLTLIEPATVERKADRPHDLDHQAALPAGCEFARQRQRGECLPAAPGSRGSDSGRRRESALKMLSISAADTPGENSSTSAS